MKPPQRIQTSLSMIRKDGAALIQNPAMWGVGTSPQRAPDYEHTPQAKTEQRVGFGAQTFSIAATIDISALPTALPIAADTLIQTVMAGPDKKIERVTAALVWPSSTTVDYRLRKVCGRWRVWLAQYQRGSRDTSLTVPVEITDPGTEPFRLGSTGAALEIGRPIELRIAYEAASAASGEVPFWQDAEHLAVTITLS